MILGIGIDIVEINRIQDSIERLGDKFLNKIFTKKEIEYCLSRANKYQHFAVRFAAKEAVYKALASGWNKGLSWQDIEVINKPDGLPEINLKGNLKTFLSDDKELKVSLSHSNNYAVSNAVIYKKL